jgi:hypothetical protein
MIKYFASFENAAFYAEKKRGEGFFAEILDEGAGFLYGPIASGGFRVTISEFAAEEGEDPPLTVPDSASSADRVFRYAFVVSLGAGVLAFLGMLLKKYEKTSLNISPDFFVVLLVTVLIAVLGIYIGKAIRALFFVADDSAHKLKLIAKIIIALIALFMILMAP